MPDPQLRAADADREAVAAVLGRALSDGRLTVDEYEERLAKAYAARTYGDLSPLTADLPSAGSARRASAGSTTSPVAGPGPAGAPRPVGVCGAGPWGRARSVWTSWVTVSLIVTAVWLATSIGNGRPDHFWPIWVIVPWGAMLFARTVTGGGPRRPRDRHGRLY